MPHPDLLALVQIREVQVDDTHDVAAVATALLSAASIQLAFTRLDRTTLACLAVLERGGDGVGKHGAARSSAGIAAGMDTTGRTIADVTADLSALGSTTQSVEAALSRAHTLALVDRQGDRWFSYMPVTRTLEAWPALGLPGPERLTTEPPPPALEVVSAADTRFTDATASTHSLETVTAISRLITELSVSSARELGRGGITLPDSRRLATAMAVDLQAVPSLVSIAARAQLITLERGRWQPADASASWRLGSTSDRWAHLAGAWFESLPPDIRAMLAARPHSPWGEGLADYLRWLYPAGGDWMHARTSLITREAELLGITASSVPSTAGSALLSLGAQAARQVMSARLDHHS
jgi:hypothetical protein